MPNETPILTSTDGSKIDFKLLIDQGIALAELHYLKGSDHLKKIIKAFGILNNIDVFDCFDSPRLAPYLNADTNFTLFKNSIYCKTALTVILNSEKCTHKTAPYAEEVYACMLYKDFCRCFFYASEDKTDNIIFHNTTFIDCLGNNVLPFLENTTQENTYWTSHVWHQTQAFNDFLMGNCCSQEEYTPHVIPLLNALLNNLFENITLQRKKEQPKAVTPICAQKRGPRTPEQVETENAFKATLKIGLDLALHHYQQGPGHLYQLTRDYQMLSERFPLTNKPVFLDHSHFNDFCKTPYCIAMMELLTPINSLKKPTTKELLEYQYLIYEEFLFCFFLEEKAEEYASLSRSPSVPEYEAQNPVLLVDESKKLNAAPSNQYIFFTRGFTENLLRKFSNRYGSKQVSLIYDHPLLKGELLNIFTEPEPVTTLKPKQPSVTSQLFTFFYQRAATAEKTIVNELSRWFY